MKGCVGHLIEAERRGFAGRIRLILAEDRPILITWDQPVVALARRDDERPMDGLLAEFSELRADSVELIRALRPSDLDRTGRHPFAGDLAVRDVLAEWPHHDRNHIRQAAGDRAGAGVRPARQRPPVHRRRIGPDPVGPPRP